jgi:hypothetical protein
MCSCMSYLEKEKNMTLQKRWEITFEKTLETKDFVRFFVRQNLCAVIV